MLPADTGPASATFVDVHYHAAPDACDRRHTVAEAGREYARLGGY
ncbi:hypothetical protein ACFQ71_38900 [Streptomyces sp. NPDC056534]